jgi:hypothetical protein
VSVEKDVLYHIQNKTGHSERVLSIYSMVTKLNIYFRQWSEGRILRQELPEKELRTSRDWGAEVAI